MSDERFAVVTFDRQGFWLIIDQNCTAERAVTASKRLVDLAEHDLDIERVMITDSDDFAVFLWRRGDGIVFPSKLDLLAAAKRHTQ